MKRTLIISIVVLLILVIVGGFSVLFFSKKTSTKNNSSNTGTVATNESTNAPERVILTREEKGNIDVNASLSYKSVEVKILNAAELDEFHGQRPKAGNKFVLLFTAPVQSATSDPSDWIGREGKIVSSTGNAYPILESQIVGEGANVNTGYLWFETKNDDHNFRLVFSTKEQEASVQLGF